jgi:hypothetical protein
MHFAPSFAQFHYDFGSSSFKLLVSQSDINETDVSFQKLQKSAGKVTVAVFQECLKTIDWCPNRSNPVGPSGPFARYTPRRSSAESAINRSAAGSERIPSPVSPDVDI